MEIINTIGRRKTSIARIYVKPGKGNQFTRTKLKNLLTGSNLERTFKSGEKFEIPDVANREMSFLYKEGTQYMFMDKASYDQIGIEGGDLGEATLYLTENLESVSYTHLTLPTNREV